MARANRHFVPGCIWHITNRCHNRDFLLKFNRDRRRWLRWLFEARKRHGLCILNYTVTSNHVHLVLEDTNGEIPAAMGLVDGQVGREYNDRKKRKGAFWEDRYHAAAVESGEHLQRCMVYIDLNMVRAGVVEHPIQWRFGGYLEIQHPPQRYRLIDANRLATLLGMRNVAELREYCGERVTDALLPDSPYRRRDARWTESIAIGSEEFVIAMQKKLAEIGRTGQSKPSEDSFLLRELNRDYVP